MKKALIWACLVAAAAFDARAESFSLVFSGGMSAGGNLFRAVSAPSTTGNYTTPDGRALAAAEFRTELEETAYFALRGRMPLRRSLSLSLGLGFTDMDVTANRRTIADNVDQIDYDQVFVFAADLSAEYDFLPQGNRPFLSAGIGSVRLDFEERQNGETLDQTKFGLFLGGGFRVRAISFMDLDVEARAMRVAPDFSAERDRLVDAAKFEGESAIWIWQIGASWVYSF